MRQIFQSIILASLLVITSIADTCAQSKTEDVVYLKNGTIVHGTIVQMIPNESVKIETADHNTFVFKMEEVEKITKASPDYYSKNMGGSVNCFDIGYVMGIGDGSLSVQGQNGATQKNDYHAFSIRDVIGYRVNSNLLVGGGLGFEHYSGNENYLPPTNYIPLFFAMRAYSKSASNSQGGFSLDIGYDIGLTENTNTTSLGGFGAVTVTDKYKGGFFINPALCIRMGNNPKLKYSLLFGYQYQTVSIEETGTFTMSYMGYSYSQNISGKGTLSSSFLTFRAGMEF